MKENLYTIPVSDAFNADCECPICAMYKKLETDAIDFTIGPSYMEDDVREATSRLGFCEKHLEKLYKNQNRLGLALIMQSHLSKQMKDIKKLSAGEYKLSSPNLFKKKEETNALLEYLNKMEESCFVCEKIDKTFERYIVTIFYLYSTQESFREKFYSSKGFCVSHFKSLYAEAPKHLKGNELQEFIKKLTKHFLDNLERVNGDIEWFIDKFDYRYADEPWKNSKDALPRTMLKTNSFLE